MLASPRKIDFKDPLATRVPEKWYLGHGSPRVSRGPLSTKRGQRELWKRLQTELEFIYARLIDQLSLPPPRGPLSWPIEEERQSWEPPMLESQKVARYSTDFSLENARKKIPFSIHILRSFLTFRESAVPLLLFIVLLVVSRELLRTFADKFLIFSTNSNDYRRLDKRQIDLPVWKFRFQSF